MSEELLNEIMRNAGPRSPFHAALAAARDAGYLVEVGTCSADPTIFVVGYVTQLAKTSVSIQSVDEDGEFDGDVVIVLNQIRHLAAHTRRCNEREILRRTDPVHYVETGGEDESIPEDLIAETLEQSCDAGILVSLRVDGNLDYLTLVGFVLEVGEETVLMRNIDELGYADGITLVLRNDIQRIYSGTGELRTLQAVVSNLDEVQKMGERASF